jgi:hypothetical protein
MAIPPQLIEGRPIRLNPCALVKHRPIPVKPEPFQRPEDIDIGARQVSRCIEILDPHQPLAAILPRLNVTRDGGDQ